MGVLAYELLVGFPPSLEPEPPGRPAGGARGPPNSGGLGPSGLHFPPFVSAGAQVELAACRGGWGGAPSA